MATTFTQFLSSDVCVCVYCVCSRACVKLYLHTWNIILDIVILVVEASKLSVEQMFRLLLFFRALEVYTQEVPKPN